MEFLKFLGLNEERNEQPAEVSPELRNVIRQFRAEIAIPDPEEERLRLARAASGAERATAYAEERCAGDPERLGAIRGIIEHCRKAGIEIPDGTLPVPDDAFSGLSSEGWQLVEKGKNGDEVTQLEEIWTQSSGTRLKSERDYKTERGDFGPAGAITTLAVTRRLTVRKQKPDQFDGETRQFRTQVPEEVTLENVFVSPEDDPKKITDLRYVGSIALLPQGTVERLGSRMGRYSSDKK